MKIGQIKWDTVNRKKSFFALKTNYILSLELKLGYKKELRQCWGTFVTEQFIESQFVVYFD